MNLQRIVADCVCAYVCPEVQYLAALFPSLLSFQAKVFFVRKKQRTFLKKSCHSHENPIPPIRPGVYLNLVTTWTALLLRIVVVNLEIWIYIMELRPKLCQALYSCAW